MTPEGLKQYHPISALKFTRDFIPPGINSGSNLYNLCPKIFNRKKENQEGTRKKR
jgi:hypothetical protein